MNWTTSWSAILCTTILLTGCDGDEEDRGTPPMVESLSLDAQDVVVGAPSELRGTLAVSDPDGDVLEAELTLLEPSGASSTLAVPISGVDGLTEATIALQLMVLSPTAGTYEVAAVVIDAEGNRSSSVQSSFEAG